MPSACFKRFILTTSFLIAVFVAPGHAVADPSVSITGEFSHGTRSFVGTVSYTFNSDRSSSLIFHLPPNRQQKDDQRRTYYFPDTDGNFETVKRRELPRLNEKESGNAHLPQSLKVQHVKINNRFVSFKIRDNPLLPPKNYSENALLIVAPQVDLLNESTSFTVEIAFRTDFPKIPEGYVNLLYDFIPRPVLVVEGEYDFADMTSQPSSYSYHLTLADASQKQKTSRIRRTAIGSVPVVILNHPSDTLPHAFIYLDQKSEERKAFFDNRISKVERYLIKAGWIAKPDQFRRYIIWDGPLSATGSHIFLPRRLFRYHSFYYKAFEISLIKAIIEGAIKSRYTVASKLYPWLMPAIQSEVIRSYLTIAYESDSYIFPWGSWLNPDFYEENSINNWISKQDSVVVLPANTFKDYQYQSNVFHPWYEKGFHLFRTIVTSDQQMEKLILPNMKKLLKKEDSKALYLNRSKLFSDFGFSEQQEINADRWLSKEGRVDYAIQSVKVHQSNENKALVKVSIGSHGTLEPVFELRFFFPDGRTIDRTISDGAGEYQFFFNEQPEEIIIDPHHYLLEGDVLNNAWRLPLKLRPFWDFPSSDDWIVTISPVINGNTFDKNLFGLSLNVSYLNLYRFQLSGWRSEEDEHVLWESSLSMLGKPWNGSEISLQSSELNASYTQSIQYKHTFFNLSDDLFFLIAFQEETLDPPEDQPREKDKDVWRTGATKLGIPVFQLDFTTSTLQLTAGYGKLMQDATSDFYQQRISNQTIWYIDHWSVQCSLESGVSYGSLPLQKKYAIGGPEGLPGFPRETELLFAQRKLAEIGITTPAFFNHSRLNLLKLLWLDNAEISLMAHWGEGADIEYQNKERFQDIELEIGGHFSWLNKYEGEAYISIAQPIAHKKYKDYRIILFSNWVF